MNKRTGRPREAERELDEAARDYIEQAASAKTVNPHPRVDIRPRGAPASGLDIVRMHEGGDVLVSGLYSLEAGEVVLPAAPKSGWYESDENGQVIFKTED